jgi:DNA-binding transcriptional LysR family regulator
VEIVLDCEQSTALVPRVARGEIDVALVSRDRPARGVLLFHEPLVWVAAAPFELWHRDPLPVAVYEPGSQARKGALQALKAAGRRFRVVVNTPSLAGQLAAVESGVAVGVLTRCSVPPTLRVLDEKAGLPALPAMAVAVLRSRASHGNAAVDALHELVIRTLRRPQ